MFQSDRTGRKKFCDVPTGICKEYSIHRSLKISGLVNRRTRMALTHEKKARHLYPLLVFRCCNLLHLRHKAVTKGTSNVSGGFVRLLLEDVKKNRAACRLAVRRYDSQKPHSAESSTINTAETGGNPVMDL